MRLAPVAAFSVLLIATFTALSPPAARAAGQLDVYRTGLDWPVALAFASDGRVFFAERNTGSIRVIENDVLLPAPYFTLTNTLTAGEQGLLGLALHPAYPTTPFVYAYQSFDDVTNGTQYNRVVRLSGAGNTGSLVGALLAPIPMGGNHNGGILGFSPDGKLYVTTGDTGPPSNSQLLTNRAGKVLRVNDDGTVPTDNPFYGSLSQDNFIFTYGHRNMFGLAFHPTTGRVFVTENGPNCNDEVNLLVSGGNFGWGPTQTCASPPPAPQNTNRDGPSPILPIWFSGPPMVAPTNAAVYAGPFFPSYQGDLIFGDVNWNRLRRLDLAPPNYDTVLSESTILTAPGIILDVEAGPDGAIWFTTPDTIYRYWDTAQPPVASFTANPSPANVGVPVSFDASASSDPDGTIVSYAWDFGDGNLGGGVTTAHTYGSAGSFDVILTVTDNDTFTDTATQTIIIFASGNVPPSAAFTAAPNPSYIGVPVTFNATNSLDTDGTLVSYAWNFGDGTIASGMVVAKLYIARGTFAVTLTVTDDGAAWDTANLSIVIANRPPEITAVSPPLGTVRANASQAMRFTVAAIDPDFDPLTYEWRVDGAVAANAAQFDFIGQTAGLYRIAVNVSDGTDEVSREWTVTVVGGSNPPPFDLTAPWAVLLALLLAVVAILLIAAWVQRRRRGSWGSVTSPGLSSKVR